eukprot:PITA_04335
MQAGYYWPTLFKDAHAYARKCLVCQRCAACNRKSTAPLQPVAVEESFQQWDLDIIGEIFPHSSKQHHYILTTTDYFTWWMEAIPLKQANDQEVIIFLQQNIISRKEAILPPNIYLPALQLSKESLGKPCLLVQRRKDTLHKLQEERLKAKEKNSLHQSRIKRWFDRKSIGKTSYSVGDLVLKWDKAHEDKGKHTEFQSLWIGPYIVHEKLGQYTYRLQSLDEKIDSLPVNDQGLKHYFE